MNKIFKVIWSKSRNCYVVASELAKGHTKASSTGDKTRRLALAAITALMLLPVGGYSYAADTATVTDTNNTQQTVYTQDGADNTFVKKGSNNGNSLTIGASESTTYSTHQFVTGTQTTYDGLNGQVVTQATGDQSSISLKVGNAGDLTYDFQNYSEVKTTREEGTTFTYHYEDGAQTIDNSTTIKGNAVTTGSVDASNGVVDGTTQDGTSVQSSNTVGQNLNALDTQVKANTDQFTTDKTSTALHVSKDGNLIVGTKENQIVKNMKINGQLTSGSLSTGDITSSGNVSVTGKVEAEAVYDDTTKTGNYVVQTNSVGANLSALDTQVKSNADAIEEEARKRKYSVTNLENADKQLQTNIDNEAAAREAADTALDTRITNVKEYLQQEAADTYVSKDDAAVQDGAIVKASNTIGDNVTQLDAALAKETADRLGADAAQDKVIQQVNDNLVSSVNTINKNMADGFNALSQADAKEAQERAAADAALDDKITAETSARVAADTKLVEAVNSGVSLSDDNVLQKNTTTIDAQGNVTTSKTDANEMILNKGKDNQITLNENGIKVGTNSSVMDANGVYTGGDDYDAAQAAMSADGKIKGANGKFTVDTDGNVASGNVTSTGTVQGATLTDGTATISNGNIKTNGGFIQTGGGNVNTQGGEVRTNGGKVATSGGEINTGSGNIKTVGGDILTAGGKLNTSGGDIVAGTGNISGQNITASGVLSGDSLTVAKGMTGHSLTLTGGDLDAGAGTIKTTGAVEAGTLTTTGDATIGGDLTVNGKLNVDEIDLTKNGIVGDNNVTASTKVAAGEITGYKKATSTKDGSEKESAIDYDENGTSTWAKSTDADGNWKKSTLTVEGSDVTSKVVDSDKNSNLATQTSTQSQSTLTDADKNTNTATQSAAESSSVLQDKDGKTSTFNQRVDEILNQINSSDTVFSKVDQKVDNITSEVTDGTNTTSSTQTTTDITNTATNGTISNNAKELTNTASDSITNKAENGNISNMASNGTISNEAKTISNKAAEAMTNDAKTITNTASESVTTQIGDGSAVQSVMNESGIANKATGKSITNDAATITNTGTTSVTNQVGNNKVLVDTTHVQSAFGDTIYTTWDESGITNNATDKTVATNAKDILNTATGNITNSAANGTITNTAKDLVNTATGNMTNTVGGELKTTVTGKVTEDYKSDLDTTVGGNQTTTVTGDSSLTAENINNTAKNKITNKALDVETDASSSIVNKVSNEYGSNTSTQLSYQTKEEMSQADGKTASYLRGAAEEKSQLTDGDKQTTIDTIAGQTNTNITDGTNTSNDLQKANQIASSVTDGTNTTVVNQDATSLASSITDGTKANNTNNTVDKSEQLIKASDTQYSATTKTATKTEDALVSGSSIIDVIKSLNDAGSPLISSAVTDGTNTTGVTQTAKDITNTAKNGTIANDAQNITNKASETLSNSAKNITNTTTEDMTNTIGRNLTTTVGGDMSTEVTGNQSTTVKGNQSNTVEGTLTETVTGKTTENYNGGLETTITGEEKHTVNGTQINNITGDQTNTIGGNQTTTVTGDSSLSAKNITNTASETLNNSAKNITNSATEKLSNSAAEIENKATTSINNSVGDNVSSSMTTNKITESVKNGTKSNTFTKTADKDINIVTDGTSTSTLSQLADSVNTSLKNGTQSLTNKKTVTEDVTKVTDNNTGAFSSSSQKADSITNTVKDGTDTSEVKQTASEVATSAKDITNAASEKITNQIGDGSAVKSEMTADGITNTATKITNITGNTTVTSDTTGTTFENTDHNTAIKDGTITKTTIAGNTLTTGQATMDYADVMKDLGVHGNATVDGDTTLGKEGADTKLTVNSKSTFKDTVKLEKTLEVDGTSTFNDKVTVTKGGLDVNGGTTTDTLHVTSTSTFDGTATFKDAVTMEKDLSVGGNATVAGSMTASSYKVGDKTYIDSNGINANNQKVVNVAPGRIAADSTDAVNGSQLYQTNERVTGVENKVNKLDSRVDKVGANAAALANLHPLEFDADSKWNIAAAVGGYKGETATAIGAFYRPNENVMVNVSSSFGTGENMYGGGLSFRIGQGGNKARRNATNGLTEREKAQQKQIDYLTSRLDALLSVINPNMSKDFPDVPENHWAYEAVSKLAGNGIIQGYEDGKYHGERTMTRYEMAEIIYNALSKGAKAEKKLVEEFKPELQAMAAQKKA